MQSKRDSRARLKQRLLTALKLGAGSVVMATAVTSAAPAAVRQPDRSVVARADDVRARLQGAMPGPDHDPNTATLLAWWGNWHNWGGPGWHNWPNWHNWHNWGNFRNW